jgi:hypothetical protein
MQEMDYREEARNGLKFRLNSSSIRQGPVQCIVLSMMDTHLH